MEKRDSKTVAATKRRITDGLFEIMRDDPIERVTVREGWHHALYVLHALLERL